MSQLSSGKCTCQDHDVVLLLLRRQHKTLDTLESRIYQVLIGTVMTLTATLASVAVAFYAMSYSPQPPQSQGVLSDHQLLNTTNLLGSLGEALEEFYEGQAKM